MKGVKCEVKVQGLKCAHQCDSACYMQFLTWMDEKMSKGFEITEWEATWQLTEFRRKAKNYIELAYKTITTRGPNAAILHYQPLKSDSYRLPHISTTLKASIMMAHTTLLRQCTMVTQLQNRVRHTHGCCRVMWVDISLNSPFKCVLISCTCRSLLTLLSFQRA